MLMDLSVVYMSGPQSEEMRYSLRSLVNYPHSNVVIVGDLPSFVNPKRVTFIPGNNFQNKHRNTTHNLFLACQSPAVSEKFALFNDDFFVTEPVEPANYHRGRISELLQELKAANWSQGRYIEGMKATAQIIGGDPYSYDIHVPMLIEKSKYIAMLNDWSEKIKSQKVFHKRTLYGHLYINDATYMKDPKVQDKYGHIQYPYTSTNEDTFNAGFVGQELRKLFPRKCEYEL